MSLFFAFSFGLSSLIAADLSGSASSRGLDREGYIFAFGALFFMIASIVAVLSHRGCAL